MRNIILKQSKNVPEYLATISGNNFGDQIVEVWKENLDGSKNYVYGYRNYEGEHETTTQIIKNFNERGLK